MAEQKAPGLLGVICAILGAGILLVALDVVPSDPSAFHAPKWVVGLCGLVFLGAGLLIWANAYGAPWMSDALAFVIIASLALVGSWVAFGPGERQFSGSGGPIGFDGANSTLGRIVFGVGAVLTWIVALIPLWRMTASLLRPGLKSQQRSAAS